MSQDQLGARVYLSGDMIGKIEQGQRTPNDQFVEACGALPELGTNGALRELRDSLKDHLQGKPFPGWFIRWPDAEAAARTLRWFEPLVVPGLLQTEDYARAILSTRVGDSEDDIEEMVQARINRQAILDRDTPPMLWVILDEGVLRRNVGGPGVMKEQLRRLADAADRPHIVIQVIPCLQARIKGSTAGRSSSRTSLTRRPSPIRTRHGRGRCLSRRTTSRL